LRAALPSTRQFEVRYAECALEPDIVLVQMVFVAFHRQESTPETGVGETAEQGRKKRMYRPGSKKPRKAARNFGGDVGIVRRLFATKWMRPITSSKPHRRTRYHGSVIFL